MSGILKADIPSTQAMRRLTQLSIVTRNFPFEAGVLNTQNTASAGSREPTVNGEEP